MKLRVLGLGGLIVLLGLLGWIFFKPPSGSSGRPVSEAEARAHLAKLVAAGQARDFDQLCSLAGAVLNCRRLLDHAGRDAVPPDAPAVVSATYHEASDNGGTPGWVLVVEGTDGKGKPYQTEVLVFRDDENRVVATNAVYWSNFKVYFGDPNGETSPDVVGAG